LITILLDPDPKSGSGTGTIIHPGSGSAKAKSYGSCGFPRFHNTAFMTELTTLHTLIFNSSQNIKNMIRALKKPVKTKLFLYRNG
jgi:hypothetical protein